MLSSDSESTPYVHTQLYDNEPRRTHLISELGLDMVSPEWLEDTVDWRSHTSCRSRRVTYSPNLIDLATTDASEIE
jgi:hypothetical protein